MLENPGSCVAMLRTRSVVLVAGLIVVGLVFNIFLRNIQLSAYSRTSGEGLTKGTGRGPHGYRVRHASVHQRLVTKDKKQGDKVFEEDRSLHANKKVSLHTEKKVPRDPAKKVSRDRDKRISTERDKKVSMEDRDKKVSTERDQKVSMDRDKKVSSRDKNVSKERDKKVSMDRDKKLSMERDKKVPMDIDKKVSMDRDKKVSMDRDKEAERNTFSQDTKKKKVPTATLR